jgi:hypothetical protein
VVAPALLFLRTNRAQSSCCSLWILGEQQLLIGRRKNSDFQWYHFFLLSEVVIQVEKSEHNKLPVLKKKNAIFLRLLCFSPFSMNLSHVPRSKRRKNQRVERFFSSSFSPGGLFKFFVVVEEEGVFFLASSSFNSLFTGRTTTVKKHLRLFYLPKCLKVWKKYLFKATSLYS